MHSKELLDTSPQHSSLKEVRSKGLSAPSTGHHQHSKLTLLTQLCVLKQNLAP